jgi:hypothetical protein
MNNLDYESLFIYMSLIFAISIFIVLLYGCAFASGGSVSRTYENFVGDDSDIKTQLVSLLTDYEKKLTDAEEKKKITGIIEKINTNKIGATDLISLTYELKKIAPAVQKDTKDTAKDTKDATKDTKDATKDAAKDAAKDATKDTKDTAIEATDPTEEIKND